MQAMSADDATPDTWRDKLFFLSLAPRLGLQEVRTLWHVPGTWPTIGEWLQGRTGHAFPVMAHMASDRPRRALAHVLDMHIGPAGLLPAVHKQLAAMVYAAGVRIHY
jgi:hypothetical protein